MRNSRLTSKVDAIRSGGVPILEGRDYQSISSLSRFGGLPEISIRKIADAANMVFMIHQCLAQLL